jgi:crotonobetainyl-CoA:carnitine CoA-transferase CaiB-like acyl-CoA transferase
MYAASDGWIAICAPDADSAKKLAKALELPSGLPADPADWGETEAKSIAAAIVRRDTRSVLGLLERAGVWAEECSRDAAHRTLNDPRLVETGTVHVTEHAQFGTVREIGQLFRYSRSAAGPHKHTAQPGEHTREVLSELGCDAAAILDLYERKIVA